MVSKVVQLDVNGQEREVMVAPLCTLLEVLRDQLGLTAAKAGCQQGGCGGCSVLVDGELILSCLTPAENVTGRKIMTLEGLSGANGLHPIQQAFLDNFATQCGFCTPGMILSAKALLDSNPSPSREAIVEAISGNLCRCTGYAPIVEAVEAAAASLAGEKVA